MEPQIQYCTTKDGVSIAYTVSGEGPPLVIVSPSVWSHIGWEERLPDLTARFRPRLSQANRVVRFDIRGSGLSERNISSFTLDALVLDLAAVADELELDRFALMGPLFGGRVAIAYAARHPERVSRLVLYCCFGEGQFRSAQAEMTTALADKDWELFTETIAHASLGWESGELAHSLAMYMRESVTPEVWKAMTSAAAASSTAETTKLLTRISASTLVVHLRDLAFPDVSHARYLASHIPGARLALLEGKSLIEADQEAVRSTIADFLSEGERPAAAVAEPPAPGAFRTVLFTDVEGSTALTQRLGDAKAREVLREHERITREVLIAHGGTEVKTMGDGFMASFGSVTKAVECAIALQRAFAQREGEPLSIRIGLNAGEPIEEEGDLFGATVILAARIAAQAQGGEILASLAVRELCAGKGFLFADTGEVALKGFEEPVRLFEVRWQEEG